MNVYIQDVVVLDRGAYTTCSVSLHGAAIVSWRINNREQLFVSKQSAYGEQEPCRAGISMVFPKNGQWTFGPENGFARNARWEIEKMPYINENSDIVAEFSLTDDDYIRSVWSYSFKIMYRVVLKERELSFEINIRNTDLIFKFEFSLLFHMYFLVNNARKCHVYDSEQYNSLNNSIESLIHEKSNESEVIVDKSIDYSYSDLPKEFYLTEAAEGRCLKIRKCNFFDILVWNAWYGDFRRLFDTNDNENIYSNAVCIEIGETSIPVTLCPGDMFEGWVSLDVVPHNI